MGFLILRLGVRVLSGVPLILGYRQVGKASDFDSDKRFTLVRRFESCYPSHLFICSHPLTGIGGWPLKPVIRVQVPLGVPEVDLRRGLCAQVVIAEIADS